MSATKVWPVRLVGDRRPIVTNQFSTPGHLGIDIMFDRLASDPAYKMGDHRGSRHFFVPDGAMVCAAMDGYVLYAKMHLNGFRVRLAHANDWPWQTLYLHLRDLKVKAGELVQAGQSLGLIGYDSTDSEGLSHLHLERRDGNNIPHDPVPWLRDALYI